MVCQGCEERLLDGGRVAAYVYWPCCGVVWLVGQARCDSHPPSLDALATLGVRELIVTGRIGRCVDQAYQRDWPVLLPEQVEAVSPRASGDAVAVSDTAMGECTCPLALSTGAPSMGQMSLEEGV